MGSTNNTSYWQVFRLIFVIFSFYLLRDAFYRWDGFRYYASFSEFVPSVALITILWSIVAVFTAMLVWLLLRVLEWSCRRLGLEVRKEHFLLFMCFFVLLGIMALIGKRLIWADVQATFQLKLIVFLCVTFTVIFLIWLFRNKSEQWIGIIQERITPLVWLFGIWIVLSVPLVAYHTWIKQTDNVISQSFIADKKSPNIILVTFDALTARDMSAYSYHRPTTPFISEWSKSASLFRRLEAESNHTTPTTASLMTGKRLWTHQTYHLRGSKPEKSSIENLPLVLKNNGYYTMAFVVNRFASVKVLGIAESFDIAPIATEFQNWRPSSLSIKQIIRRSLPRLFGDKIRLRNWIIKRDFIFGKLMRKLFQDFSEARVPPEKAFSRFLAVIDNNLREPFFVWIHLLPPHDPFLPPAPYMAMFDSSSELRTFKSQRKELKTLRGQWKAFKSHYFPPEVQPTVDIFRARYDEFIRYCDKQFEDFINGLTKRDILKNTVIIMSSDHGESFEHNYLGHGGKYLYEQVTHIPLIIKEPNQTEGQIINDLIEQIDIPATILDLAGIPVPTWMEGRSLAPLMRGKRLPSKPLFSMNFQKNKSRGHKIRNGSIAVWEGDYKLIYYLKEKKSLLFNLKQDPDELNNLFDKEPEVNKRLFSLIHDNLKKANVRLSKGE